MKRIAISLTLVCIIGAIALYVQKGRIERENRFSDKIWTIELVGSNQSYKFKAALGTFLIHKSQDIDSWNKTVSGMRSVNFRWAYPGGEPWPLWRIENPNIKMTNQLTAKVSVLNPDKDTAAIAKEIYLDGRMKSTRPALVPRLQKVVWDGEASLYRSFHKTIYLIEKREEMDARIIACTDSATYCRLHGARLTQWLTLEKLLIPQDRVSEWKQYQQKARELVMGAMVSADP